ncbi:MAG: hypothetical protein Q8M43_00895 [Sulfuricurvum sp.]|jgi:hypothetical protein|uniref:hypothetical protein n=1 Tax=Sulfuricurvum sp. TaxID=2025608 RepID=UPI002722A767|nr:hypothetical protein [Sulfuricurvum sp.]MDO9055652.1 hypothetical protein [Sulfuricurvum sp.]MDP2849478.1 hypothetical protein [Sulfuricurvum sp.]MDP3290568.1 hypothetical protein [Sulfuricurvum sp.]
MKKHYLLFLLPIFFVGCFNERGVTLRYYSDCEEYYDLQGYYHKQCDKNIVDYSDIKDALESNQNPNRGSVR